MIKSLMENGFADIASYIDKERLINTFTDLIKINSPSFNEREAAEYIASRLRSLGCDVFFQDYGESFNLIAHRNGGTESAAPLMLSAHMDTIEPTQGISFSNDGSAIKSIGNTVLGADDKSAIAQIIEAITVAHEKKLPVCDIEIVFTSAEEKGLCGAKNLDFSRLKSKHALVLDSGGSVGSIVVGAPSHHTYEMLITGKAAHAGIEPERGVSAIRCAAKIIAEVPDGRIDEVTTANIGIIKGGTATNVVPKEVVINGEVRSHNAETLEQVKKRIFDTAKKIASEHGASIDINVKEEYNSFRIREDDSYLKFLSEIFASNGIEAKLAITGGGSDANIFNSHGIKALNISNGMQKVHSAEEFILLDDLYKGCLIVLATIISFQR
ncbi:MAG: M20/M25/M40 family metallo-hydrolase [Nitrospirae bacterium]|nr:MAG: M20/M25/M40 family metallo-hydrolase [Nitrospirota bacterium]